MTDIVDTSVSTSGEVIQEVNLRPGPEVRLLVIEPDTDAATWKLPADLVRKYRASVDDAVRHEKVILEYLKATGQHIPYPFPGHQEIKPDPFDLTGSLVEGQVFQNMEQPRTDEAVEALKGVLANTDDEPDTVKAAKNTTRNGRERAKAK